MPRDSTQTTSAQHMTLQPCHTVLSSSQADTLKIAELCSTFVEKIKSAWRRNTRHQGWDRSNTVRTRRDMTALRQLSDIDMWSICLANALFKHDCVFCWFLPDDGLHDDITLSADHVTYKTLCDVFTRTKYPPFILRVISLMSWLCFPPSYVCLHPISAHLMTSSNTSFQQWSTHGVCAAWVCACMCAQMNSCINKSKGVWAVHNILFCICVRAETGPSCCQ